MFRGGTFAHDADQLTMQARDLFDLWPGIKRKAVGRNSHRDRDELAACPNPIYDSAADACDIDIPGNHRLVHARGAGNKNVLHRHAVLLIELRFADEPKWQHRPARLRVTDANHSAR